MARRALLIGSQTGRLTGVDNDVATMAKVLGQWGFDSTRCQAENASRAGMIDAYERLIAEAGENDAVVVYYSGHGGYSRSPDGQAAVQFIVPTDFSASTLGDFRGITSAELSLLLARLTEKTTNVTAIIDCCHSAHMSRDQDLTVRAIERSVPHHVLAAHVERLRRVGRDLDLLTPHGNRHAVRLVACAPEQSAYERRNDAGVQMGLLTDALTSALAEARGGEAHIAWASVIDRLRQRVLSVEPRQRPEAEGPAQRLLFDLREADPVATLPVTTTADIVRISGAPLLGVRPGDEFVIMPGDAQVPDPARRIGEVRVTGVDAEAAWGRLRPPGRAVPLDARAHLVRTTAPALPVRLPPTDSRLARAVDTAPLVRVAGQRERCQVEVSLDESGGLVVGDRFGPLRTPRPADPTGIANVVLDLTRLARAEALRGLASRQLAALSTPVGVEFGRVVDGQRDPLPRAGSVLHIGEPIYVRVSNEGAETVWVSLLDIGVAARITLLNPSSPGGQRLEPGEDFVFGRNEVTGALSGVAPSWPAELPTDTPRPETVMVLATSAPVDTRVLEQQGVRSVGPRSSLERFLAQLRTGEPRDLAPVVTGQAVRFAVHTIDFDLVPSPAGPKRVRSFQVDDRPSAATVLWSRGPQAPPSLRLCLDAVVVHHNRTFLGGDLRVDVVVAHAGVASTSTTWFAAVADGQRLTVEDSVVYQGPAGDRLDIAVWISADATPGRPLSDLLDGPVSIEAADDALRRTFAEAVGVYRTTLLASDIAAIEPAATQTVRAQDFSLIFSAEVDRAVRQEQVEPNH